MPQNCIVSDKIGIYQLVVKNSLKIIENVFFENMLLNTEQMRHEVKKKSSGKSQE